MEPMTLSPIAGSPVSPTHQTIGNANFLPAFLMGEATTPVTPRTNTLSPNNARNLAFGEKENLRFRNRCLEHYLFKGQQQQQHQQHVQSPSEFNRSLQHKSLFGYQSPPPSNCNGPPTKVKHIFVPN